jgi:hypothetical protein
MRIAESRIALVPSTVPAVDPKENPAARPYRAADPAAMAPRIGIAR